MLRMARKMHGLLYKKKQIIDGADGKKSIQEVELEEKEEELEGLDEEEQLKMKNYIQEQEKEKKKKKKKKMKKVEVDEYGSEADDRMMGDLEALQYAGHFESIFDHSKVEKIRKHFGGKKLRIEKRFVTKWQP